MECYAGSKKKEILSHATVWMNLEDIMLSEISQSQKDKCHMVSPIWYRESSKSQKQKIEWWSSGAGGRGNEGLVFNGYRVSVLQDEHILEICCTAM